MASTLKDAARKGRGGDTRLGHLSNGDRIFPVERVDEHTAKQIDMFMRQHGLDPGQFTVGHKNNRKNPFTRLPQFDEGDGSSGGQGDAAGGSGAGSSGAGTGGGQGGGGGETGGGANTPGTGGNVAGGAPGTTSASGHENSEPSTPANNPSPVSGTNTSAGTPGAPNAESLSAAPETTAPGVTQNKAGPLSGLANALGLGFLNDPVATLANFGFGLTPGIPTGLTAANTLAGAIGTTKGVTTTAPGQTTTGQAVSTGPSFGGAISGALSTIGDAISDSGGLSGTGGTGPSPTGGAGGSAGGIGTLPTIGNGSVAQPVGQSSPAAGSQIAAPAAVPTNTAANGLPTNLGGGIGLPLTDMLFNTYRL